ncbi:MAG: 3-dehydroquinate synthase [Ignavibacteriales bacterium]|nr:3-dehydroquinate synthase [Ignavibacteriales bacterium]
MISRQVEVSLGERSYPIYVGSDMVSSFAATCDHHGLPKHVALVTDSTVSKLYLKPLEKNLRHFGYQTMAIVFPPGEQQKSLSRANTIFSAMLKSGLGRKSAVIALGGGVIGDLAGFVAATYKRGVPLVQVPTTLLSQVDSSIGGKTAVNHPLGKNMIGAFYQPKFVWADIECLKTLPLREIVCGLGEIIKYGIISDAELFSYLEKNLDQILNLKPESVLHVQATCSAIKAGLVSQDERESGVRVILNFGHTVGHALEAAGKYKVLKHGEAVLLGMMAESYIARELAMIDRDVYAKIVNLIRRVPLKVHVKVLRSKKILEAMGRDKKSVGGKRRFVLPTRIGHVKVVEVQDQQVIRGSLDMVTNRER